MSQAKRKKWIRAWHRRLAPLVGIQLFLWSLGGFYFAWMDTGGVLTVEPDAPVNIKYENYLYQIPPLIRSSNLERVSEIRLGKMLNVPVYRFIQDDHHGEVYNAITGELLSPINSQTAVSIARAATPPELAVRAFQLITSNETGYAGPLPAWRIQFAHWASPAIYVSAHTGQITARRNHLSRFYTFLWKLHILDFGTGNNVNNAFLKIASLLGLVTIASGYYLFYLTIGAAPARSKPRRKPKPRKKK